MREILGPHERLLLKVGRVLGTHVAFTVTLATAASVLLACLGSLATRGYVHPHAPIFATVCCVATALPVHLVLRAFTLLIFRQREHLEQQQDRLKALNHELVQVNADLSKCAHRVAHDLRNPLFVMQMTAQDLSENTHIAPAARQEMVQDLLRASDDASGIIDSILLLSQARRAPPRPRPCLPSAALVQAIQSLEHKLAAQAIVVDQSVEDSAVALAHAPWLERIWVNLIDNAIKYGGPVPHIKAGVAREGAFIRCWVSDEGPGLPERVHTQLAEDFKASLAHPTKGFGIGLAMVTELVGHMGGEVKVQGGPGTTLSFLLPSVS